MRFPSSAVNFPPHEQGNICIKIVASTVVGRPLPGNGWQRGGVWDSPPSEGGPIRNELKPGLTVMEEAKPVLPFPVVFLRGKGPREALWQREVEVGSARTE